METVHPCPFDIIYIRRTGVFDASVHQIFFVLSRRTAHVFAEDFRIIAGAGKPDLACDFGDAACVGDEQRKTFLYAVPQQIFKRCLVQCFLEDTAEFTFARVARFGHLVEGDRIRIAAVDKYNGIFKP